MPASLNVNFRTVVHATSGGICMGFPDVCKTPTAAGPIPIPYPNIAKSQDTAQGSSTVSVDDQPIMLQGSCFAVSTGDEAGSAGGVASSVIKGKAEFINYSFDVMVEGKSVCRLADMMLLNTKNTPPFPLVQPPIVVLPGFATDPTDSASETKDWSVTEIGIDEGEDEGDGEAGSPGVGTPEEQPLVYDEQVQLINEATGEPVADCPYVILLGDQLLQKGRTDKSGMTARVASGASDAEMTIVWGSEALAWS